MSWLRKNEKDYLLWIANSGSFEDMGELGSLKKLSGETGGLRFLICILNRYSRGSMVNEKRLIQFLDRKEN